MMIFPRTELRNERDLARYVAGTSILCAGIALAVDVTNQLIFFTSWAVAVRSWLITIVVVVMITVPVSRKIGRAQITLYLASTTDELTGLLNRRAFLEGVGDSAIPALIIVDVDHFKDVNDRHGHWIGDQVLRATAALMKQSIGHLGRVGRIGGEEFALLAHHADPALLLAQLEAFRQSVSRTPFCSATAPVSITISAGVATRSDDQTFEQLFVRADRALYRAKALGRNRIVCAETISADGDAGAADTGRRVDRRWPGREATPRILEQAARIQNRSACSRFL